MNKTIKILSIMMVVLMMISSVSTVFAGSGWIVDGITASTSDASNNIQSAAGKILGIVQVIAMAVAVIMLIVLAIKYISAAPEGKAEIKKTAFIYVFGAVLMFGASGVLGWIKGLNLFGA